jgi:hypothetical protein
MRRASPCGKPSPRLGNRRSNPKVCSGIQLNRIVAAGFKNRTGETTSLLPRRPNTEVAAARASRPRATSVLDRNHNISGMNCQSATQNASHTEAGVLLRMIRRMDRQPQRQLVVARHVVGFGQCTWAGRYSNAPMSQPAPYGRGAPR